MRQTFNRSNLILAVATALALSNLPDANAQQQSKGPTETSLMKCPDTAYEIAYETPKTFISWLLEHPTLVAVTADAERRADLAKIEHISLRGSKTDMPATARWAGRVAGGGE